MEDTEERQDYNAVVNENQRAMIAAYFLALANEFKILRDHPHRVWALGKARASMWIHSEIPEEVQLGVLITAAVEVYPAQTKRICEAILGKRPLEPRELGAKWAPYLKVAGDD